MSAINNDNADIILATQAEKTEKKLSNYLNFFTMKKAKKPFLKKGLIYITSLLLCSQLFFAINDYHHFSNYEELINRESMSLSANHYSLKQSLNSHDEPKILLNYIRTMEQQTYMSNMLMAAFTMEILRDKNVDNGTKEMIRKIWNENKYTGINQEYQNFKHLNSCMSVDIACHLFNKTTNIDAYDKIIRERMARTIYQIDNLDEFLALSGSMEGKNMAEKKEFEQKESEYVKENALKSRPQDIDWTKEIEISNN